MEIIKTDMLPAGIDALEQVFKPFKDEAAPLLAEAEGLTIESEEDTETMARAREIRLELRTIRVECDKARKREKEIAKRVVDAVDAINGDFIKPVKEAEARLQEIEKHAEIMEAKRRAELEAARMELMRPYLPDGVALSGLADMTDEEFEGQLETYRLADEARKAKAEAEAEAAEKARHEAEAERKRLAEERAKVEEEQRRLTQERDEIERKAREEAREESRRELEALQAKTLEAERLRKLEEDRTKSDVIGDKYYIEAFIETFNEHAASLREALIEEGIHDELPIVEAHMKAMKSELLDIVQTMVR